MNATVRPFELHRTAQEIFGAELRHRRVAAGLSIRALAEKVLVAKSLIYHVETAQRFPSLDTARRCDELLQTGGVLMRLHAFVVAERERPQPTLAGDLRPAEVAQLRQLLAAMSSIAAAPAGPSSGDLLDDIDRTLSAARSARPVLVQPPLSL